MTEQTDPWQEDINHLLTQCPTAPAEAQDEYAERVSIMVKEAGETLERARLLALNGIKRKWKC